MMPSGSRRGTATKARAFGGNDVAGACKGHRLPDASCVITRVGDRSHRLSRCGARVHRSPHPRQALQWSGSP